MYTFFYIHVPRPCVRLISYFSFSLGEAQRFAFCCSLATYSSLQRVPDGTNGSHTHNPTVYIHKNKKKKKKVDTCTYTNSGIT